MISSRPERRDSLLFVYGTLRPFADVAMARWLRRVARYIGPATTRGRLYDLGAYPGLRAGRGREETVAGDVFRIANPRLFRVLDRYETRFKRERCTVQLTNGARRSAWIYRYRYNVVTAARIASGDYLVHCRMRSGSSS